jgi:hypothetical protein
VQRDLYESESSLTVEDNEGICPCWMEDVERLDEIIGRLLPVVVNAEQDFDRALRASYVVLELIEMQATLLGSYLAIKSCSASSSRR